MEKLLAVLTLGCLLGGACFALPGAPEPPREQPGRASRHGGEGAPGAPAGSSGARRVLLRILRAALLAAVVIGLLLAFEGCFIFYPTSAPALSWDLLPAGAEECTFQTADGLRLHAWWHPGVGPDDASLRPVVLWCHGNAGNITHRADNLDMLARRGLAVFLFDYRGYGRSEGKPSERGLYEDARAAYRCLTEERGVAPARIVCFGRSLGAAVAVQLALDRPVAGVVLEGAFKSVPAMARKMLPWLPIWLLLRNRFDTAGKVPRLTVPLLMFHGSRDEIAPLAQGRAVFEAAPEPKAFCLVEGGTHNDTYAVGGEQYLRSFAEFCRDCVTRAQ